jgi:hypothetical protein
MKVRVLFCFGLLTVLLFGSVSCKKHKIKRKYTGDFLFTVNSHTWNINSGSFDTTYTYPGRIVITDPPPNPSGKKDKNVYLKIYFGYNGNFGRTAVDKEGIFTSNGCSGSFISEDEVNCAFEHSALSSAYRYSIHGVRR